MSVVRLVCELVLVWLLFRFVRVNKFYCLVCVSRCVVIYFVFGLRWLHLRLFESCLRSCGLVWCVLLRWSVLLMLWWCVVCSIALFRFVAWYCRVVLCCGCVCVELS